MAARSLDHITPAIMDDAARRLGAPDHTAFLSAASHSMKCAFRLICELIAKHETEWAGGGSKA
jgi:hypothetical protein